jgi:hypothetical protein
MQSKWACGDTVKAAYTCSLQNSYFGVSCKTFRVMAPFAFKRAFFKEECCADAGSVMYGKAFYFKNIS